MNAKGENFSTESLFLILIIQQQKKISELIAKLSDMKNDKNSGDGVISSLVLGCSGWNYPDTPDKGGWTSVFYPYCDITLNSLRQQRWTLLFTKFYSYMTKGTLIGIIRAPEKKKIL